MSEKKEKFIIVDGNALLHRAFHAIPPLTTKDGLLVNAVYGFVTILMRVLKDLKPTYAAVTFDLKAPTFRHKEYVDYKANRQKQPDELYAQIPLIREIVEAFRFPIFEKSGFEADDLIGTISAILEKNHSVETYIITGDFDTLQLVDDNTYVYTLKKSIADTIIYNTAAVIKKYDGLKPNQLIDFKALRGDPSDNIPGVKGIGEKTAIQLLQEFKTLEQLYKKYTSAKNIRPRIKELLQTYQAEAMLSKKLATIVTDVPINFSLENCHLQKLDKDTLVRVFQKLEFRSLLAKLPELEQKLNLENTEAEKVIIAAEKKITYKKYKLIQTESELKKLLAKLMGVKEIAIDTETSSTEALTTKLVGISLSWKIGEAYYIDFTALHNTKAFSEFKEFLKGKSKKIGHNIKFDSTALQTADCHLSNIYFDTMIGAYLLQPGERRLKLDGLAFSEFGHEMIPIESLLGKKGQQQLTMDKLPAGQVFEYACEDADYTFRLYQKLKKELAQNQLTKLFTEIEMPLVEILGYMEKNGIKIDKAYLAKLNTKANTDIALLEKEIFKLADEEFNIASPLQLKKILFEKLNISTEGLKKIKTGISTAAGQLEKMRGLHPIIDLISDYRELAKLRSTYIEALPKLINPNTQRVHTSFNQTIAATGRLSSSDPNIQNIPIRTPLGKKVRGAFISESGKVLLSADYSQIELRVVAHLSQDKRMIEAFQKKQDIHRATAAFIFNTTFEKVDSDMRRKAKEVNFGVLYGMSAFGLAERTGISRYEAKDFIDRYFQTYRRVKEFTEETIALAKSQGYVETLFGRKRYLPEINSEIALVRNAAQRAAINLPVQGTSADIIKLAMIAIYKKISCTQPDIKMLLQVHDELVFEVPKEKATEAAELIKQEMEAAAKLSVPLIVDVKQGINWLDMEKI
jgi:DNA polymerase-1